MKNLAIIPARGGSKRISKKNIKEFLGKPIIAYSIEIAIKSGLFEEIIVSTDDKEIADIAINLGAKVPFFRSSEASNDFAPLADVIDEVKQYYINIENTFDNICCILPTAPLLTVDSLKNSFLLLGDKSIDSVTPVVRFSYPVQRAFKMQNDLLTMFHPENKFKRSQDLEPAFHDIGQFYWMRFTVGMRGSKKLGFEVSEIESQDIDTLEDWKLAEFKYNYLKREK